MPSTSGIIFILIFVEGIVHSHEKCLILRVISKNGEITISMQELEFGTKILYDCGPGYSITGDSNRTCVLCNDSSSHWGEWSGIQPKCVINLNRDSIETDQDSVTVTKKEAFFLDDYEMDYDYNEGNAFYYTYDGDDKIKETDEEKDDLMEGDNEDTNVEDIPYYRDKFKGSHDKKYDKPFKVRPPPKGYDQEFQKPKSYYDPTVRKIFDENFNRGGFLKYSVCSKPEEVPFASLRVSGEGTNSVAYYKCNKGFKPEGSEIRKCQKDGEWSGTSPSCIPDYAQPNKSKAFIVIGFIFISYIQNLFILDTF